MKTKIAALVLAALGICSGVHAQTIEGAFGQKLGDKVEAGLSPIQKQGPVAPYCYAEFKPEAPYPHLTYYSVSVTPQSHLVFDVSALGDFPSQAAVNEFMKILETKYGNFKYDGDRTVATTGTRQVGGREIKIIIYKLCVIVIYRDNALVAVAKIEGATGKSADGGKGL